MSDAKDQFYHDVFVTALEGGIGYWSQAMIYKWSFGPPEFEPDYLGFHAMIVDLDDDADENGEFPQLRIDRAVIVKAFSLIRQVIAADEPGDIGLADDYIFDLALAYRQNEAGNIDAGLADCIVQLGLFGKVIYG